MADDSISHARRGFLRGKFKSDLPAPQRPPWALPEDDFLRACTRCNRCSIICPTRIIRLQDGYPVVDFSAGECTFCSECVRVCTPTALRRGEDRQLPWTIKAQFSAQCLAERGVECRICGEHCDVNAIRFPPRLGGVPAPQLDSAGCTGCGGCVAACPVHAVHMTK